MIRQVKQIAVGPSTLIKSGLRVVAYFRMSSEEQTLSIEQQRKACREHAARMGWTIVAEYIDEGKSGSKEYAKRKAFHRMIADSDSGDWKAVLCWDSSRFGRLDTLDGANEKKTLRKNGVHLECVREGKIDWTTSIGRLHDAMLSESNHDYSLKVSGNSIRGRHDVLAAGYWPHGAIPFGYDREYFEGGVSKAVVPRNDRAFKARGWRLKLKVNKSEAVVVQWIFEQFANRDTSLRKIADELSTRGTPTPKGGRGGWNKDTVKDVLRNPAYVGDIAVGQGRRRTKEAFERLDATIKSDACEAIIDRKTFAIVSAKLQQRKDTGRQVHTKKKTSALSGVCICGNCNYRMDFKTRRVRVCEACEMRIGTKRKPRDKSTKKKVVDVRDPHVVCDHCNHKQKKTMIIETGSYFTCSSPTRRKHLGCKQWRATEQELLRVVIPELREAVDWEILQRINAQPPKDSKADLEALKKLEVELAKKSSNAAKNILSADPAIFPQLQDSLVEMQHELTKVRNTIQLATGPDAGEMAEFWRGVEWLKNVKDKLIQIVPDRWHFIKPKPEHRLKDGTQPAAVLTNDGVKVLPDQLRDLLHKLNTTIKLHWTPNGSRYYRLDTGVLRIEMDRTLNGSAKQ